MACAGQDGATGKYVMTSRRKLFQEKIGRSDLVSKEDIDECSKAESKLEADVQVTEAAKSTKTLCEVTIFFGAGAAFNPR